MLLKLPLTFEENQQEQEFNMQWETLKKTYTLYKERRQNPQTYIDYLQLQIIRVKDQSGELMSQIQKIEKDAEEFHSIFDQYKQQANCKIDELNERNCNIEYELTLQQTKNRDLTNQNATLLKQIQELQLQNFESQSGQISNNASYTVHRRDTVVSPNTNRETDSKFKKSTPGIFAIRPDSDVAMEVINNGSKVEPSGLKIIYKMLGQNFKNKMEFYGIKLVFENKDKAENFKIRLINFFEKEKIYSFTLLIDEIFDSSTQVEYIYKLQFMNCKAYFFSLKNPEKSGELLLAELEKYVEISNIPREFRKSWHNIKANEEEIPEELRPNKGNSFA